MIEIEKKRSMIFREVVPTSELSEEERQVRWALWRAGDLSWKLKGKQVDIYNACIDQEDDVSVILCSRRFGKCLKKGTLVPTMNRGFVPIEELKIGEYVYGYNSDGTVTPTKVLDVINQGEKEVVDLVHNGRKIISCTLDHKFLTNYCQGERSKQYEKIEELAVKDFKCTSKIKKEFVSLDYGSKNITSAYALGALLGDGCSRQKGNTSYFISSKDREVVEKVAKSIKSKDIKENSKSNYTWRIGIPKDENIPFYNEWCKGRYAHEKILEWEEVKTWNRKSKVELLAGLFDTDGSIGVNSNILTLQLSMQARPVIEVVCKLIKELWFYDVKILLDDRTKYVNGPVYQIVIRNNHISKRIVKELDQSLMCPRKKWKDEYENLPENNTRPDCIGIKIENPHKAECFDIEVDNETHLYLVENGLVTHNSTSVLIAEIEICIQNDHAITKHACPTQKMVKEMMYPNLKVIFHDAPPEFDLNKIWYETEGKVKFPNGSIMTIAGTDGNNADNLRGAYCHFAAADEAGFMDKLDYVVKSILLPQTDTTGGKLVMLSTPNFENPQHEFHTLYVDRYEKAGKLIKFTLFDSPMVDDAEREKIIARYLPEGVNHPKFKCEYLVEVPKTSENNIVPEFYPNKQNIVIDYDNPEHEKYKYLPQYFDFYVGGDIGTDDLTVFLFGYYNNIEAELVILDEWVLNGNSLTTKAIINGVEEKEEKWFKHPDTYQKIEPYLRVMDNDKKLVNDFVSEGIAMRAAVKGKGSKLRGVLKIRQYITEDRLKIHPRCKHLIYHLESGQWKQTSDGAKEFAHLDDSIDGDIKGGHVDSVDALSYLIRSINEGNIPTKSRDNYSENQHASYLARQNNIPDKERMMKAILGLRRRK